MHRPLVFLDTETTGLDSQTQEVIEIAMIRDEPDGTSRTYYTKIAPDHIERAHPEALAVNGYNELDWTGAPRFPEVAEDIANFLKGAIIVGHNVSFDVDFLKALFKRHDLKLRITHRNIDTQALVYEHLFPAGLTSAGLDATRKFLGWSTEGAHTAMKDATDARRLYWLLARAGRFRRFRVKWQWVARTTWSRWWAGRNL